MQDGRSVHHGPADDGFARRRLGLALTDAADQDSDDEIDRGQRVTKTYNAVQFRKDRRFEISQNE